MANIWKNIAQIIPWIGSPQALAIPDDLRIQDAGIQFDPQRHELDFIWLHVVEEESGQSYHGYRVIRLLQLKYIPMDVRRDAGLLQKMRTALRGIYGAGVNLVYLAAGIFDPAIGIVQCYGVTVFAETREAAIQRSGRDLAVLKSTLAAAYRQTRLEPLTVEIAEWIFKALQNMPYPIVTVGHPDPRENARGGDSKLNDPLAGTNQPQQFSLQQNELLFRGMSSLREEFLLMLLANHIRLEDIATMLASQAENTSNYASHQMGVRAASFGVSLPAILTGGLSENASNSYGTNHSTGVAQGQATTDGVADTTGQAHSIGHASTRGWAHTVGVSETDTTGHSTTTGTAISDGVANTHGVTVTDGSSHTDSSGFASSHSDSSGYGVNGGVGGSIAPAGVGLSANVGGNASWGSSDGTTVSSGSADTSSHSVSTSNATTTSHGVTQSQSQTTSSSHSVSNSEAWTTSGAETDSVADTSSQASTKSHADSLSTTRSQADASGTGQVIGRGLSGGMSVGVAPSFSLSNSYQWQEDPYILLTHIMRTQQRLLDTASKEGAYYTDVYALARSEQGAQSLIGLIPEAFHGTEDVVTGVQARSLSEEEKAYILLHARAFTPSTRVESIPEVMSGYADSTVLTMLQVAAYTAPGMYEHGTALTVQEETPSFAFYPSMPGDVVLGHQWSSETGELTDVLLRLSPERHFHTAFAGDTGFGKSIAAERLAFETTRQWHYRTIVLDFGQGWRKALDWPGMEDRVDIRQLQPGALCPLRWNILQIPRRVESGRYRTLVAELFANAGRMGPRQLGFIRRALTEVYQEYGVLTGDPVVQAEQIKKTTSKNHSEWVNNPWAVVRNETEAGVINAMRSEYGLSGDIRAGAKLSYLEPIDLQALAIQRSKQVSIADVIDRLQQYKDKLAFGDMASRTSLEGVLLRLEQFGEGQMVRQYGRGEETLAVEDLGLLGSPESPWGITVIEGGSEMDEYPKAALLSLLASILYFDAVARRREALDGIHHFPPMQIFFEEANKVLTGVSSGAASDQNSGESNGVSHIFQSMWRDGRKYSVYLHLLAQTVSELPTGILSSCANVFVFQTKDPKDRDLILPHLGRSEKGLVNTEYKRYLARIPKTYAVAKFGYSDDVHLMEPILMRPLMIACAEPSDEEIANRLRLNFFHTVHSHPSAHDQNPADEQPDLN
jgi:hypothetical protein